MNRLEKRTLERESKKLTATSKSIESTQQLELDWWSNCSSSQVKEEEEATKENEEKKQKIDRKLHQKREKISFTKQSE